MSAGSPIIKCRISPIYLAAVEQAIARANKTRKGEPYTMSSWMLAAIMEKLDHTSRSVKAAGKRRKKNLANSPV